MYESVEYNSDPDLNTRQSKGPRRRVRGFFLKTVALLLIMAITSQVTLYIYKKKSFTGYEKLREIDSLVKAYASGEIDQALLEDSLASAYLYAVDSRYGFYKSSEDAKAVADSFEGASNGIGVTVWYKKDMKGLTVIYVDSYGPAHKAGMEEGDVITDIDGKSVTEMGVEKSLKALKKQLGESVTLTVLRGKKELKLTCTYEEFVQQTVYSRRVEDYTLFSITAFNDATVEQFKTAVEQAMADNTRGFIFDLRDNGGGTVDSACQMLDILVGECDLFTIRYGDGTQEVTNRSDANRLELPMAVLVNEQTASASELFAATLRAMSNAAIIGNTTYGKGVVQTTFYLTDGSCIRFTVGEFFVADGTSFNEVGIKPDHEVTFTDKQKENRFSLGDDDPYILKAVECLENKK